MTELFPPPSAPPFAHGQSNWPVILCSVLAAAYGVTMFMLMLLWCCKRPRHTIQVDGIESGLVAAQASSGDSLFKARTVNRGRSALLEGSTTPGVDLELIDRQIRMGFVRKVYTLLSTQLLATVGIVVLFIKLSFPSWVACTPYVDGPCETMSQFGYGLTTNAWVIWVAFVPLIFMICCLHAVKNKYPFNYGALLLFTLIESCVVAILCTLYFAAGFGEQILLAFGITMGIFLVLTLFTLQSKVDWGFLGPGLVAALFMMIFWSWITFWLVPYSSFAFSQLYSLFGAILFCGFIIYDTNAIMRRFGVDDWLIAAIELYLDVINLFLFLLQLLSGGGRSSN